MKRFYLMVMAVAMACFLLIPGLASAKKMGSGTVTAGNVDMQIFGSTVVQPKFVDNANFGEEGGLDFLFYTNGAYADHAVRQQTRLGVKGGNENFNFLMTLESDFNMDADEADREEAGPAGPTSAYPAAAGYRAGTGAGGDNFGVERLHLEYDMSNNGIPASVFTGWDFYSMDAMGGGGFLYGDDWPYLGIKGSLAEGVTWDIRYWIRDDNITGDFLSGGSDVQGENGDWRLGSASVAFPVGPLKLQPTYVYSVADILNSPETARTNYIGFSALGKFEMLTPKAELFYAYGEMENYQMTPNNEDADIRSIGAFAGSEMPISSAFTPYFGGYWLQGDDDANDDEINGFNGLSNAAAILGMFGMPNGLLNQGWLGLGSGPFTNQPSALGGGPVGNGIGGGSAYGTNGLAGTSTNPGLKTLGLGFKGTVMENLSYKTQYQYMMYEETGAMEDGMGRDIDEEMGHMFDLNLTYNMSKNFSIGNTFSYFEPGDGIEDRLGASNLDATIYDSVNFTFHF